MKASPDYLLDHLVQFVKTLNAIATVWLFYLLITWSYQGVTFLARTIF